MYYWMLARFLQLPLCNTNCMPCQVHTQFIPKQASFAHSTIYFSGALHTINVHVRMYVCMYVCMYVRMYVHTYVRTCVIPSCSCPGGRPSPGWRTKSWNCALLWTNQVCLRVRVSVCLYVCVSVYVYVHRYVCTYVERMCDIVEAHCYVVKTCKYFLMSIYKIVRS